MGHILTSLKSPARKPAFRQPSGRGAATLTMKQPPPSDPPDIQEQSVHTRPAQTKKRSRPGIPPFGRHGTCLTGHGHTPATLKKHDFSLPRKNFSTQGWKEPSRPDNPEHPFPRNKTTGKNTAIANCPTICHFPPTLHLQKIRTFDATSIQQSTRLTKI